MSVWKWMSMRTCVPVFVKWHKYEHLCVNNLVPLCLHKHAPSLCAYWRTCVTVCLRLAQLQRSREGEERREVRLTPTYIESLYLDGNKPLFDGNTGITGVGDIHPAKSVCLNANV